MKNPEKPPENPLETIPKPDDEATTGDRGGRPSRDEAERRRIMAIGVDPALVDPRRILAGIAIDETAPAGARVTAARALLLSNAGLPQDPDPVDPDTPGDELTRRALALMAKGRPN